MAWIALYSLQMSFGIQKPQITAAHAQYVTVEATIILVIQYSFYDLHNN